MNTEERNAHEPLTLRIDAALRSERPRPLPHGFHARLQRRIRIATMVEKERRAFHRRMVHVVAMGILVLATATVAGLYWDISETFLWDWPGLLGYIDYLAASTSHAWWISSNPALMVSLGAVLTTLLLAGAVVGVFREPRRQ